MKKKIVIATMVAGLLATGFVIPQVLHPSAAMATTEAQPTLQQALKFFQPKVTDEMRAYGKKNVDLAKPDMNKLKQGILEIKLPKQTGNNFIYVGFNDKFLNKEVKGGVTVTARINKGQINYIDVDVEDGDLGQLAGMEYTWDDANKKLTMFDPLNRQLDVYKQSLAEQKKIDAQLQKEQQDQLAQTAGLTDITNHWAKDQIVAAVKSGLVSGYPDHTFQPDNSISHAEFITMLVKALGYEKSTNKPVFTDVSGWAEGSIAAALDKGLLKSTDTVNNQYHPDWAITRNEIAVLTVRALGLEQKALDITNPTAPYPDTKALDKEWVRYIQVASDEGILHGNPDGTFRGNGYISRAEAVSVLMRIKDKLKK